MATLKWAILEQLNDPPQEFADCILDHFRLKKRTILDQLDNWEQLAEGYESETKNSQGCRPMSGGMECSKDIVSNLCREIRKKMASKELQ